MSQMHHTKPFLRLDHVNFSHYSNLGEVKVLNDINFSIEKGDFAALVGSSGCGKSTILSLIADLLKPVSGYITFYSEDFSSPRIGYMLQHDHLLECISEHYAQSGDTEKENQRKSGARRQPA